MRRSRRFRLGTLLAFALTATVIVASAANAGQSFHETFHDEETRIEENFCGVPGLTVEFTRVTDTRMHVVPRGRDGLAYFSFHIKGTEVVTNLANEKTVTGTFTVTDKDLRVTDNGDGTLTILVLATGNAVLYGEDGKAIARNPGQTRFEILVDHAGTPTDPSDDEFLEFLGEVKESTGRTDDYCEAAVPALTD
jgi:hypothetical protein